MITTTLSPVVLSRIADDDHVAWRGFRTRRGTSNMYDVTWHHHDNQQVSRTSKTVVIEGNAFSTLSAGTCEYKGTVSDERKMVRGSKICAGRDVDRPWEGVLS